MESNRPTVRLPWPAELEAGERVWRRQHVRRPPAWPAERVDPRMVPRARPATLSRSTRSPRLVSAHSGTYARDLNRRARGHARAV